MFTLTYGGKSESFEDSATLDDIRTTFDIPKRKNIYRTNDQGELERITQDNRRKKLRNADTLEALSDFTLGCRSCS